MISKQRSVIAVTSDKGGSAKTTTSMHLAGYLSQYGKTIVIDGDVNKSALFWARMKTLPFEVVSAKAAMMRGVSPDFVHRIIDTEPSEDEDDLRELGANCDLLLVTIPPDPLGVNSMRVTRDRFANLGITNWRVLITIDPPPRMTKGKRLDRSKDGEETYQMLKAEKIPVLDTTIRQYRAAYTKATGIGVLVYDSRDRYSKTAWADYVDLGEELTRE